MSPERARVFYIEDDPNHGFLIGKFLELSGHVVVGSATNLSDALNSVDNFNELKVDVAIIDGNLNSFDASGNDGRLVLDTIKKIAPHVKTIGMSANHFPETDVDLGKENLISIGGVVNNL